MHEDKVKIFWLHQMRQGQLWVLRHESPHSQRKRGGGAVVVTVSGVHRRRKLNHAVLPEAVKTNLATPARKNYIY